MLRKPASQVTAEDVHRLVEAGAAEDDRLEFKREMYGSGDDHRREMVRDIVAMANDRGGLILIGVETDDDDIAVAVPGIEGAGHDTRVRDSALANVDPRLSGLDVSVIPLPNDRSVLAIGIPESLNGPHMTTFRHENVFWRRYGSRKGKMAAHEIEAAYMRRIDRLSGVEEFLTLHRSPPHFEDAVQRWLVIQAMPVFMRDEVVNINDERIRILLPEPPAHPQLTTVKCSVRGAVRPTLHGLRAEERSDGTLWRFLSLHREGYLEFGAREFGYSASAEEDNLIPSKIVYGFIYSFVHLYRRIVEHLEISTPSVFALTITRPRDLKLGLPQSIHNPFGVVVWDRDLLVVPSAYATDVQTDAQANEVVNALNDRLWNAFGFDRCELFGEDGGLV